LREAAAGAPRATPPDIAGALPFAALKAAAVADGALEADADALTAAAGAFEEADTAPAASRSGAGRRGEEAAPGSTEPPAEARPGATAAAALTAESDPVAATEAGESAAHATPDIAWTDVQSFAFLA
jgi:hypothetical protein